MESRTQTSTLVFRRPFSLKGTDGTQPAGTYKVEAEEELVEGLSFPVWRRVSTILMFQPTRPSLSAQAFLVNAGELAAAHAADAAAPAL